MLANNFYTVHNLQSTGGELQGEIHFNRQHPIFSGHFPAVPVVPGVCMMQLVKELVEDALQQTTRLPKASQLKFLNPINPDHDPSVLFKISFVQKESSVDVSAELKNAERSFFKMKALLSVQ